MAAEKIKTVRGLKIYKKTHKAVKKLLRDESTPEIHGNKVWFSSYFIMDYLDVAPLPRRASFMEIGCGWGILSVYCARKFHARVTAVDADPKVFPFLKLHAKKNGVTIKTLASRYEKIPPRKLAGVNVAAGGDICFWEELVNPLFKFIRRALAQGVETIIIADPGRPPFLKLAKRCGKYFNAQLLPYAIDDPLEEEGYLLIIHGY